MDTKLFTDTKEDLKKAANIIRKGGTVIFPTETVYGLGANATDENAVKNIFTAKGRPADNPLIVHTYDIRKISEFVTEVTPIAKKLAENYWPGPMTLVLQKKNIIPDIVSAGLKTVGIRIPSNTVAKEFLELCDLPIAAPSANLSGKPSPTTAKHSIDDMMGRVDGIICSGDSLVGVESTVIDATGDVPVVLRPGGITPEMIKSVCGEVYIDKGVNGVLNTEHPKSPGMKYKHYAPKAEVILINKETLDETITGMLSTVKSLACNFVILCSKDTENVFMGYNTICIGERNKPETFAHNLFEVFRECDEKGFDTIVLEGIPNDGIGLAVMNRAYRAAKK